jgi:tetratricopeptide (TPR) repeat protein
MFCTECGAELVAGAKFCVNCGKKQESGPPRCGNCGAELAEGAKFCIEYGAAAAQNAPPAGVAPAQAEDTQKPKEETPAAPVQAQAAAIAPAQAIVPAQTDDANAKAAALVSKGNQYTKNKDYDAAIAAYTEAIGLAPNNAEAYEKRGSVYYRKGNKTLAQQDLKKAFELDPNNETAKALYRKAKGGIPSYLLSMVVFMGGGALSVIASLMVWLPLGAILFIITFILDFYVSSKYEKWLER